MGRKPHRIIQEYFARGAKLEDASNRYQHTCKLCAERFPKGRTDSLLSHLLRKCPGISNENKQKILQELVDKPNQNGSYNQLALAVRNEQLGNDPGFQYNQNMSALETLAEVSRQQLDTTDGDQQPPDSLPSQKKRKRRRATDAQQRLQTTFAIHSDNFDPELLAMSSVQNEPAPAVAPPATSVHQDILPGIVQYANADIPTVAPTARMVPDQLALAASAAAQMMPTTEALVDTTVPDNNNVILNSASTRSAVNGNIDTSTSDAIDPQLEHAAEAAPSSPPGPQFPSDKSLLLGPRTVSVNPDMPHVHFFNNFLLGNGPNRRVRGRFSDSRRKEVQEVRKQGACIRCRMLKKPCSGGSPCTTCRNVETARLWKIPCMRARIADEFDLYSAGVQTIIAFQEINEAKSSTTFSHSPNVIHGTHFPAGTTSQLVQLRSVWGQSGQDANLAFDIISDNPSNLDLELADTETQDLADRLGQYFKNIHQLMFEQETSVFMRQTLQTATDLTAQKADPLLDRALDLWVATSIFADPSSTWTLYSVPLTENTDDGSDGRTIVEHRAEISAADRSMNHRLLTQQLRAFTEKRASQLARHLINDLEKRLLQRQQMSAQHFETFITSIILLNCIERMCWLFNTWAVKLDVSDPAPDESDNGETEQTSGRAATIGQQTQPHERGPWPLLEKLPQTFVEKGISIANLVAMLLKMRGIPPPTAVAENGTLKLGRPAGTASSRKTRVQNQKQSHDHPNASNDELVAHLAQAAAAAVSGAPDETDRPGDAEDESELVAELSTPVQDGGEASLVAEARVENGQGGSKAAQGESSMAATWFEKVNITEEQLRQAQAAQVFDENDWRCWDLRFIAGLLLSED